MANYYDWNPPDDKPKDKKPAVDADNQPDPSPLAPPEQDSPVAPVEAVDGEASVNQWSPEEFAATPSAPPDDAFAEPVDLSDVEDELHPMYRVVAALMEAENAEVADIAADEQTDSLVADVETAVASEPVVVDAVESIESIPPTDTLTATEALLADAELPPIPTRIEELTQAIERYPQSPVNYVLRGEAHWEEGHDADAVRDFLTALQLAEGRDTTWEFLNRSFVDRARQGLRRSGYTNRTE